MKKKVRKMEDEQNVSSNVDVYEDIVEEVDNDQVDQ